MKKWQSEAGRNEQAAENRRSDRGRMIDLPLGKKDFKQSTKALFMKYTVLPIFFFFVIFFIIAYFILYTKTIYDTNKASEHIRSKIQRVYESYSDELVKLSESSEVHAFLQNFSHENLIFEHYYSFNNKQDVKSLFFLYDETGKLLLSTTEENETENGYSSRRFLRHIQRYPDQVVLDVGKKQYSLGKITALSLGKAIVAGGDIKGAIVFQLFEKDLLNILFYEDVDIAVITDYYDNIIATTNELTRGLMNKFRPDYVGRGKVKVKDTKYHISELKSPDHSFKIYTLKSVENQELYLIYSLFTLLTGLCLYILVRILAEKMATKNVQSINKLVMAVQRLQQGDLKAYVDIKDEDSFAEDEFAYLYEQYNIMVKNLYTLMKRNEELARIRQATEIKMLKAQFNPHFLFNVLETLRYTILVDRKKAEKIIMSLSKLLRYSLDSDLEETILEKDLSYTYDYLTLHKYRFNDRLDYEFFLPDEVMKAYVPKLILQPIIENSLKYGYAKKMELQIYIFGRIEGNTLCLTVFDDGFGIEPEVLEKIKATLNKEENDSDSIGLYNAHRRLKLLYGDEYGLTIRSMVGVGTEIELRMPYKKAKDGASATEPLSGG